MSALEAASEGTAGAPGARDSATSAASPASAATAGATGVGVGGAAVVAVAPPVVVVVPPPPASSPSPPSVSCPDVAAAAMSVLNAADTGGGHEEPGGDLGSAGGCSQRGAAAGRAGDTQAADPRMFPDPLWRRTVPRSIRDELIRLMQEELQRITGQEDRRHLRICAARYESYAWRRSDNHIRYFQKMGRRIDSLRDQPSFRDVARHESSSSAASSDDEHLRGERAAAAAAQCPLRAHAASSSHHHRPPSSHRRPRRRHGHRHPQFEAHQHFFPGIMAMPPSSSSSSSAAVPLSSPASASSTSSSGSSPLPDGLSRDERYFRKLRIMKAKYRDEVALVFRELCRVNTVIQHSASLRRHESNNLGDFLANLKKIIYLLEQQPDEAGGMIPARKRTLEYLDVVESHIQRKVLPILYRLRHTYSTILRPIVLNYLRNSGRFARR